MSSDTPRDIREMAVDKANLYREETFTDLKVATLRVLTPVNADGSPDASREPIYTGETQIMTQAGPVPVQTQIAAASLDEAMEKFPEAINNAVEKLLEEARRIQQQEASRIVVPSGIPPQGPGGKIRLG